MEWGTARSAWVPGVECRGLSRVVERGTARSAWAPGVECRGLSRVVEHGTARSAWAPGVEWGEHPAMFHVEWHGRR